MALRTLISDLSAFSIALSIFLEIKIYKENNDRNAFGRKKSLYFVYQYIPNIMNVC